ncbi:FAD binding domain-containing protein [Chroogloeocystis siderophila]|jgi:CO/xanthine dehydrogenase FAD-binding subunit|uniref:Carbon monoxide dehydrogenase n=1 Tax=Chroogloeocystis siderophila 5.2 s.c.1 TaxID=247279 RepID=A0A1U7HP91_9CHRO|nr:FAD binding domain-containing protein [Chroogloeocystis siderophila]OKH25413.1 carbon monoxide dehydrogenase [Chroogloeocystis siderophila 5.2 s.c.1]
MDLHNIQTYLRPQNLETVVNWSQGWSWLAGGTWVFSQSQPDLRVLVDLEKFDWSEIEVTTEGLVIGATCIMTKLRQWNFPEHWTGVKALFRAVDELASFKVTNMATVGGNICLAIPASTFAPAMVALDAKYEIWHPQAAPRFVAAKDFQTGVQQTVLQPGEVLRRISIPQESLTWHISYQRVCIATAGIAISIVVAAYNPQTSQVRFGLGACVPTPRVVEFSHIPTLDEIGEALNAQVLSNDFIEDYAASAAYRQHITKVLMRRSLLEF